MDGNPTTRTGARVTIGDTVTFVHQSRTWIGTVVKKHRVSAHVVCGHHRGFRVPYALLTVSPGTGRPPVQTHTDHRRASFHPGDRVQFVVHGAPVRGLLARVNPQRAHVITDDEREYRVSYALLQHVEPRAIAAVTRTAEEIDTIAHQARELLEQYQLSLWSFQFDNGRKRAGSCQYGTQVISLSYEFAKHAPAEEIHDTLLHEIAHALVGKAHHHDDLWRAKASPLAVLVGAVMSCNSPRHAISCSVNAAVGSRRRNAADDTCSADGVAAYWSIKPTPKNGGSGHRQQ